MKYEILKEKSQTELKWGIYYCAISLFLSFLFFLIEAICFGRFDNFSLVIIVVHLIAMLGCIVFCYIEVSRMKGVSSFSLLYTWVNVIVFASVLGSFIAGAGLTDFVIPKNEIEIFETTEVLLDPKRNLMNDFVTRIKLFVSQM